jgi:hypothetical protein
MKAGRKRKKGIRERNGRIQRSPAQLTRTRWQ